MDDKMIFFKEKEIDKNSPIPIYYQLKEILLEFIKYSEIGTALPTEHQLCVRYQISRPTTRQALREVENSGNVKKIKGKGIFIISEPKIDQFLINIEDFEDSMKRHGHITKAKILELSETVNDSRGCSALKVPMGTKLFVLRRVIYGNDVPMVLSLSYLPAAKFPDFKKMDFVNKSLLEIIKDEYCYDICKVTKSLESKLIGDFEAELFGVKMGFPIQYVETTCYIDKDTPIEFTMERYRADKNKFNIILTKNNY